MFFSRKKQNQNEISAYASGQLINIEQVNDEVFSKKMMGDGVAIIPVQSKVYAPCDGTITAVFEKTNHAVGITTASGLELLIHCGLDTVNLQAPLFKCHVKMGDTVKQKDLLIEFDKAQLSALNYEDVIMLVVLNSGNRSVQFISEQDVLANETIIAKCV